MKTSSFARNVLAAAVALVASTSLSTAVHADIIDQVGDTRSFTFTSDHCDNGCGVDTINGTGSITATVRVTGATETIEINAALPSGWDFITTGAGGGYSLAFGLIGITQITIAQGTTIWSTSSSSPGYFPAGGTAAASQTLNGSSVAFGTKGTYSPDGYAIDYSGGNGGPHAGQSNVLDFTINATGLTLHSFQTCSSCTDIAYFLADVYSGANGKTGVIDATESEHENPPPFGAPGPMAGAGFPGLLAAFGALYALYRKRRATSV